MRAAFNRVCDLLHLDCGANDRIVLRPGFETPG
jgi:hypothetical protein